MGKRGPRPTPTKLKLLRGNPGRRSINHSASEPPADGITMPPHLGPIAAQRWDQLLPMLQAVKVMTRADVEALARYCDTYEWWLAVREKLKREGDTYPILNDGGQVKYVAQRPEVSIAHKLSQQLRQLEQDFGLNPSARSGLSNGEKHTPEDEVAEFFRTHGA